MTTEVLTISPSRADWGQIINDERFTSVTGIVQTQGRVGNRWQLALTFSGLVGSDRQVLVGHAFQLRGQVNRLQVNMSTLNYVRAGAGGGTPLINGNLVAGSTSLTIDGASINISNWLVASDFISVGNELKIVTQSVSTNGSGQATIQIWPEVHKPVADNAAVDISTPKGVFFLRDSISMSIGPSPGGWATDAIVLSLEEDCVA